MENLSALFIASLIAVSTTLYLFNKHLIRNIGLNYVTGPYVIFSIIYFTVVPFVNIVFDSYVQKSLFISDPTYEMSILNLANAFGLIFAIIGLKLVKRKIKFQSIHIENKYYKFVTLTAILLPIFIIYGLYNNIISGNLLEISESGSIVETSILKYIFIETTPLLFCWLITTYYALKKKIPKPTLGLLIVIAHLLITIALNFSRGSRSSMLLQLIIGFISFNYTIIRFRSLHYLLSLIAIALLMPVYAYYKYAGVSGFKEYISGTGKADVVENYNDPFKFLVGDIGRADIQAPLLNGVIVGKIKPSYWPETYISGAALLLPSSLRPEWIRPKTIVGADAQLALDPMTPLYQIEFRAPISTRIYALLGEVVLNFGIIGIPFAFLLFGAVSRWALIKACFPQNWKDVLIRPYFAMLPIFLLFYDFDNIVFQSIVVWGFPLILLYSTKFLKLRKQM